MIAGGRVLDVAALVDHAEGYEYMLAMVAVSWELGLTLLVPSMAWEDAATMRPELIPRFGQLAATGPVLTVEHDSHTVRSVVRMLVAAGVTNFAAGHCTFLAVERDWRVVTDRPQVLESIDPRVRVDLLQRD